MILVNQFHDIIAGSSIAEVYQDSQAMYREASRILSGAREEALTRISRLVDTRGDGTAVTVYNTLPWTRDDVASLPYDGIEPAEVVGPEGDVVPSQVVEENGQRILLFEAPRSPSLGYAVHRLRSSSSPSRGRLKVSKRRLENRFFRIDLSPNGEIARILDKRFNREVIAPGATANRLVLYEDRPSEFDAWNLDFNYDEVAFPVVDAEQIEVVEEGPVRAAVEVTRNTRSSEIRQKICVWRSMPRIDFVTEVDWHEKHRLLKACFPVNVLSRRATYEVQSGATERPTHFSTPIDRARFEVPGQRWIDLSETGYGVALLNDCKYGFDIHGNLMRISLLRAPTEPDPHADEGLHQFTYSLYPHPGSWQDAQVVRRAYELNVPLICMPSSSHGGVLPKTHSFVSCDAENVVIDWIKKAEDSRDLVLRLYEAHGSRGRAALTFSEPIASVMECDLLEENEECLNAQGRVVELDISPWEIKTLKVRLVEPPRTPAGS